jgi:hypothetical protein
MSAIELILAAKIGVTALFVVIPFLTFSAGWIDARLGAQRGSAPLYRLYGWAILALLVGYASGFWETAQDRFPYAIAVMGIVSNAGAAAIMVGTGMARTQTTLAVFFGAIALALIWAIAMPGAAMQPLWP